MTLYPLFPCTGPQKKICGSFRRAGGPNFRVAQQKKGGVPGGPNFCPAYGKVNKRDPKNGVRKWTRRAGLAPPKNGPKSDPEFPKKPCLTFARFCSMVRGSPKRTRPNFTPIFFRQRHIKVLGDEECGCRTKAMLGNSTPWTHNVRLSALYCRSRVRELGATPC